MGQTYSTLGVGKYCKATQRAVFCQLVLKQFLGEGQNISGSSLQGLLRSISWNPFIVVGFSKDHRSKQSLPIISAWNHPQNWSGMMWLSDLQLQTNGKTTHMINNIFIVLSPSFTIHFATLKNSPNSFTRPGSVTIWWAKPPLTPRRTAVMRRSAPSGARLCLRNHKWPCWWDFMVIHRGFNQEQWDYSMLSMV